MSKIKDTFNISFCALKCLISAPNIMAIEQYFFILLLLPTSAMVLKLLNIGPKADNVTFVAKKCKQLKNS